MKTHQQAIMMLTCGGKVILVNFTFGMMMVIVLSGYQYLKVLLELKVHKVHRVFKVLSVLKVIRVIRVFKVLQVLKVFKVLKVIKV